MTVPVAAPPGLPALPYPADAPQVADVAGNLLSFAARLLNPAPGAAVLWPGNEVAWDVPDGGLLYVRVTSQVARVQASCITGTQAVLGLGCLRCVDAMGNDGSAPKPASRTADAEQILLDSAALLDVVAELPRELNVTAASWVPLGPEGGAAGGEWSVQVNLTA